MFGGVWKCPFHEHKVRPEAAYCPVLSCTEQHNEHYYYCTLLVRYNDGYRGLLLVVQSHCREGSYAGTKSSRRAAAVLYCAVLYLQLQYAKRA